MKKTVLVAGLGLMGGSMAKAIRHKMNCKIIGDDLSEKVLADARYLGVIDEFATEENFKTADIIIVGLYPETTVQYILSHLTWCKRGAVIVDLCGIKQYICDMVAEEARAHDVAFIGGHPMAGREFSGFEYAQAELFEGASMILVPNVSASELVMSQMEAFFQPLGFAQIVRTSAQQHDAMIAFTSQLAHVVSSAYIKSPEALEHKGYSAGSYKDLTRVARLNEDMWTELFLHNKTALVREIDEIMRHLQEYRDSIADADASRLHQLLKEGRERKEQIG